MTVRLTFIGSGDAFAGGGRFQTCLMLEGGADPLLLDCGATSLTALKSLNLDPSRIGHVALSHFHGDHFGGLPWLILDGQFTERTKPLAIGGPPGVRERVERVFDALYPGSADAERPFATSFVEFTERAPQEFGPARITTYPVVHSADSAPRALRVEYDGKVIAYSGDTEWTDTLIEVSRDADLFVCECNCFDTDVPGHMSYQTLLENRNQIACQRIVITHMSESMLAHTGEVELETASDGAVFEV